MKSIISKNYLLFTSIISLIFIVNIKCSKTQDVVPIDPIDSTIYYGFVLNEVLYDPSNNDLNGDANGDGVYVQNDDEFVEFVNSSETSLDISGYKLFDATRLATNTHNHEFPANTILSPGQAVVVFGGGTPTGSFGGSLFFTSSDQVLNLNNSGDVLTVKNNNDSTIFIFDVTPYSDNPNQSFTRFPDLHGEYVQHNSSNTGTLFSPGTKADGSSF
tara:strand:- start:61 stop:708 length:648 start_codon:yes stop_codon:yes gene_type:complete